jgi:uncharacterized protein (DUF1330 family)
MVEYPTREAVDMVFKSEEYASVIEQRARAFTEYAITIVDDPDRTMAPRQGTTRGEN